MVERNWTVLAGHSAAVIRLAPDGFPGAYIYNALANYNLNRFDEAEKILREELKRDPGHRFPEASYMLGNILAERGDFAAALEHMRTYLQLAPDGPWARRGREQLARLEQLAAAPR